VKTRTWTRIATALGIVALSVAGTAQPAAAASYVPIAGAGSTWSYNALHSWQGNVAQYGMVVDYNPVGSTTGRNEFKQGAVDWAASDIPYGVVDGTNNDPPPTSRGFAYMPVTAGGTVFMYNLKIGTKRVTNLRLSGDVIAGIFTNVITKWNDPKIAADNPKLTLPPIKIVPVVRSDGSGSTAQFTQWMVATQKNAWNAYCQRVGRNPCTQTSAYPVVPGSGMVAQSGDLGVSGYVAQKQAVGAIGYVEYSYALETGFPVVKVRNAANYYTEPTPGHVAVALLQAKINMDQSDPAKYLTQNLSNVYTNRDRRTYPLSSYSYMVLPTTSTFGFTASKGYTLGDFGKYLLCQGQRQVNALGYSALPINLVEAGFQQLRKIPGASVPSATEAVIRSCNNPTFSTNGTNTLANNDPYPPACDKAGPQQCATGTGGASGGNASNPTPTPTGTQAGALPNPSGSAGTGGQSGGSGPNNGAAGCDPDSGCDAGGANSAGGPSQIDAVPVAAAVNFGHGLSTALMVIAGALLVGLCVVPPMIGQAVGYRRARRDNGDGR
jgi:phosphate ABC transporter phosphate-binding protein